MKPLLKNEAIYTPHGDGRFFEPYGESSALIVCCAHNEHLCLFALTDVHVDRRDKRRQHR